MGTCTAPALAVAVDIDVGTLGRLSSAPTHLACRCAGRTLGSKGGPPTPQSKGASHPLFLSRALSGRLRGVRQ